MLLSLGDDDHESLEFQSLDPSDEGGGGGDGEVLDPGGGGGGDGVPSIGEEPGGGGGGEGDQPLELEEDGGGGGGGGLGSPASIPYTFSAFHIYAVFGPCQGLLDVQPKNFQHALDTMWHAAPFHNIRIAAQEESVAIPHLRRSAACPWQGC